MFQLISQSVVLIAFVWGPLLNGGIWKGSLEHDPLRTHVDKLAACKGVLQYPLCTADRHLRT